jgi:hypothetical protein
MLFSVAPAQQLDRRKHAKRHFDDLKAGGAMFARMTTEGRLFGFDLGDWSVLLTGVVLTGFLSLLV